MRGFDDGPRNFEQWSSDKYDTGGGTPSSNYHTIPTRGRFEHSTDLMCIAPLHVGSLELLGSNSYRPAMIRYLEY
ncbi:hypothetical protein TNCV_4252961 [Trichonephila clavipes]|nr:hypothetical protein TNCV_4252961 [Trichonephila clavipes]